jgi:hypothetical protein
MQRPSLLIIKLIAWGWRHLLGVKVSGCILILRSVTTSRSISMQSFQLRIGPHGRYAITTIFVTPHPMCDKRSYLPVIQCT